MNINREMQQDSIRKKASRFFGQKIIKQRFQLRFSFIMFGLFALSIALIWFEGIAIVKHFVVSGMVQREESILYMNMLSKSLALTGVLLLLIMYVVTIIFSHQIAGPIYRIEKVLGLIKDGVLNMHVRFRKGDEFSEVAQVFNGALTSLRANIKEERDNVEDFVTKVKAVSMELKKNKDSQAADILQQLCTEYETIPLKIIVK